MDELFRIANRATVLRDGEVVGVVNIKKSNKEEITGMMFGRDLKEQYPKYNQKTKDEVFAIENLSQGSKLSRINLKVNRGEILGIAGLVGAGRTELARAIFGVDSIDSGEIILNGQKVKINSPQDAKNKGIVLIPEDQKTQGLILCLPVDSNITISNLDLFSRKGSFGQRIYTQQFRYCQKTSNQAAKSKKNYKYIKRWESTEGCYCQVDVKGMQGFYFR